MLIQTDIWAKIRVCFWQLSNLEHICFKHVSLLLQPILYLSEIVLSKIVTLDIVPSEIVLLTFYFTLIISWRETSLGRLITKNLWFRHVQQYHQYQRCETLTSSRFYMGLKGHAVNVKVKNTFLPKIFTLLTIYGVDVFYDFDKCKEKLYLWHICFYNRIHTNFYCANNFMPYRAMLMFFTMMYFEAKLDL